MTQLIKSINNIFPLMIGFTLVVSGFCEWICGIEIFPDSSRLVLIGCLYLVIVPRKSWINIKEYKNDN